jgi:hypothetical protein
MLLGKFVSFDYLASLRNLKKTSGGWAGVLKRNEKPNQGVWERKKVGNR